MNNTLNIAKRKMLDGKYTCVVLTDNDEYTSYERGVKPLLSLLQTERSFVGAVAADKCIGAGAAHLYVLLGVSEVWANIISTSAIQILQNKGIGVFFEQSVPNIINRRGDGICPIEVSVGSVEDSQEAYGLIVDTLKNLEQKTK